MATIEDYFAEAAALGLTVNNLYQTNDGRWQANFRDLDGGTPWGFGDTPTAALEAALSPVRAAQPEVMSLEDILS